MYDAFERFALVDPCGDRRCPENGIQDEGRYFIGFCLDTPATRALQCCRHDIDGVFLRGSKYCRPLPARPRPTGAFVKSKRESPRAFAPAPIELGVNNSLRKCGICTVQVKAVRGTHADH